MQTIVRFIRNFKGLDCDLMVEEHFGKILRQFRKDKSLSQTELANLAGLDRTYISLLERGLRVPSLSVLFKISNALGILPSSIIIELEKQIDENS